MSDEDVGYEQFSAEDRSYAGSRFRGVVAALFANPIQRVWGREGEPPLPVQEVTIKTVIGGLFSSFKPPRFERVSARTLDSCIPPGGRTVTIRRRPRGWTASRCGRRATTTRTP